MPPAILLASVQARLWNPFSDMYGSWAEKQKLGKSARNKILLSVLFFIGGLMAPFVAQGSPTIGFIATLVPFSLCTLFWHWGLAHWAKAKGYSPWLSLIGLISFPAIIVFAILPDKWRKDMAANPSAYALHSEPTPVSDDPRDDWQPAPPPSVEPSPAAMPQFLAPEAPTVPIATLDPSQVVATPQLTVNPAPAPPVAPPAVQVPPVTQVPVTAAAPPVPASPVATGQPRRSTTGFPPPTKLVQVNPQAQPLESGFAEDALASAIPRTRNRKFVW